ncbi:ParA family protein [Sporohalobacter salinus]|uniref:ParA family protein n=1 Tax=Sporohalobacter salinus TaxID=1494606 RepID=UPI0019616890|nr:ParA family protein [Sporohalobacter salinus]MBM7624916.1 chromosome partitioning protein [Sporohalobacter salinus]
MNIISIVNQKGGVAKTTTAINLASSLVELNKKVLVVDMDPQANMTQGLGFENNNKTTVYEILTNKLALNEGIYSTDINGLDIVASDIKLANAELELSGELGRETLLRESLQKSENLDYDYIIIDCNPSLGLLTVNALVACRETIIPVEPSIFSLEGIEQLINVIKTIKRKLNERLNIKSVLLTRVDGRTNIADEFLNELKNIFGNKVFDTIIHQNVKIAEAQTKSTPINIYDKNARGAKEYKSLAKELINFESN